MSSRSSAKPVTAADKRMSKRHLQEAVKFNQRHASEHVSAARGNANDESVKYHKKHAKAHAKAAKTDRKLLGKRYS